MFRKLMIMLAVGCGLAAAAPRSAEAMVPPFAPGLAAGADASLVEVRYRRHWRRHHRHHRRWHRHRHHRHWHHHRRHRHYGHYRHHRAHIRAHRAAHRGFQRPLRFNMNRGGTRWHDPIRPVANRSAAPRSLTPRLD